MLKATLTATNEHRVLVAAARHGLGERSSPVLLDSAEAGTVLARARFDRLTGFLAAAVRDRVVALKEEELGSELERRWRDELVTCVRLEALTVRTAELLDGAGLRWRLTKGTALAHLDYPDASVRTFGDVDVIVHPADWLEAFRLLTGSGYRRDAPTLPGGYDDRYGKGATLTTPDGLEVDLHRRLAIGRFGVTARMDALFDSSAVVELAGRVIPVPDAAGRLLHACFHAVLGGFPGLRAWRDVAQLLLVSGADWRETVGIARSWRAEAVVASAIRETWRRLELTTPHPAQDEARSMAPSRGDQRVLDLFARGAPFRSQALSAVRRLPLHEVPRYLWTLGRPGRQRR